MKEYAVEVIEVKTIVSKAQIFVKSEDPSKAEIIAKLKAIQEKVLYKNTVTVDRKVEVKIIFGVDLNGTS